MESLYSKFTNLYPVSKTLKFELIPQGKTLENMKSNNVISSDEHRAESYTKVKGMIDEYHKAFIDNCLKNYEIKNDMLEKYYKIANDINKNSDEFLKLKGNMRKDISNVFTKKPEYKKLFGKEIITEILPVFYSEKTEREALEEFSKFTTYFKGFSENRKNMYMAEDKSTAIAYRIIDENLPIFITNIKLFKKIIKAFTQETMKEIYSNLEEIIQVNYIEEMFELNYFNNVLTQKGIDVYNHVIDGYSKEDGKKIKGINEYVNEYKQKNPQNKDIYTLNTLYKQILTDKATASFVIDKIDNDQILINNLRYLSENIRNNVINSTKNLEQLLKNINTYKLDKIYIKNDASITEMSQYLFDDWSVISKAISDEYDKKFGTPTTDKKEGTKKKYLKSKKYLSIKYINDCLKENDIPLKVEQYYLESSKKNKDGSKINIFAEIGEKYKIIEPILNSEDTNLKNDNDAIEKIKDYLDSLKLLQLFIKPLVAVRFDSAYEKDEEFYERVLGFWKNMQDITSVYNKTRNYLTEKPYSIDKIKLNFNNPTLLSGWAVGKEIANSSLLFRKDGLYYLGIINNNFTKYFKKYELPENEQDIFEKMEYMQAADPQKDVQNLMIIEGKTVKRNGRKDSDEENRLLEKLKNNYLPKEINEIRLKKSYSKLSENFSKEDLVKFIDYYKERVIEYYNKFTFEFKNSEEYVDFGEFTTHINEQAYKITFKNVSAKYIEKLVNEGMLYLFKIYNKDFSEGSHGNSNLHTLYWQMLFDKRNLANVVYKLDGKAEVFYRKASLPRKVTHPKNEKINNKNKENKRRQSEFEYDLIKDKRFTEDKFQLHVPITANFKGTGISNINEEVNKTLKQSTENYVIGIDRGERHLLYLTLLDSKGNIIKQNTLNVIENKYKENIYITDYHTLLNNKEKAREKARESWQSIENIKELKEGFLSQTINKITDLMIKYNAIVVLEDLNTGFMRERQKIEKQVYQKFEKMLINKLNYLVKKDIDINEKGGLLNAYQLTNKFESFKKLGKQSGFLFYVPAWNTSKIDPTTGFVNLFYVRYENETKAKEFFEKIDDIRYNKEKMYFEFDIDYEKFTTKAKETKTKWTLCTYGERVMKFRNEEKNNNWDSKEINLTTEFINLFKENKIDIESKTLKTDILNIQGKAFWERLIYDFRLMLQMRNSITGTEIDYIISPVADKNGRIFDSRLEIKKLPKDADANGAYNIARKGLWIIDKIKETPDDKLRNIKLAISNKEWLQYVQNEGYKS